MERINNGHWIMSQLRKGLRFIFSIVFLSVSCLVQGQESEEKESALEEYALEDLVVTTGSYIPELVGANFASPVAQITSEYIEDTGLSSNVLEILRKSVPQFYGNSNIGRSNADLKAFETGGGSKLGLRNTQTLVLVNGRRIATSPIVGVFGHYFVDVNMVPVSAVDKIEILKDGASATYGTDATSGVVNIILKNNYEGLEAGGRYSVSSNEGNWEERRFDFTGGIVEDGLRVTLSGEWYKSDPLWYHERDFAQPKYGGADFGGKILGGPPNYPVYVLNPALDTPPVETPKLSFAEAIDQKIYIQANSENSLTYGIGADRALAIELSDYVTLLTGDERKSLITSLELDLSDHVTFFSDLILTQNESFSQVAAQGIPLDVVAPDHPYNPVNDYLFPYNRFLEYPRARYYDTDALRFVTGFKGHLENGFGYEVGMLYNRSEVAYRRTGQLDAAGYFRILELTGITPAAGPGDTPVINPFSRVHTPGVLDDVFKSSRGDYDSVLKQLDARIYGDVFSLPGGEVKFALGTEYRKENLRIEGDPNSVPDSSGDILWLFGEKITPLSMERDVYSFFLELKVPIIDENISVPGIHSLELELAARHEHYSDVSDPTVPKIALIWEPFDETLFFRGTYSESFNAPNLFMLVAPEIFGPSPNLTIVDVNGVEQDWKQVNVKSQGNANLDPGESKSVTVGFVWQPKFLSGFSMEFDYYRIKEEGTPGFVQISEMVQDVELKGPASQYASLVLVQKSVNGPLEMVTTPGELLTYDASDVYVTSPLVNVFEQTISGVDLTLNYGHEFNEVTNLFVRSSMAWVIDYEIQPTAGSAAVDVSGMSTSINGTTPNFRVYSVANLKYKNMGFTLGHSFIPSMPYEGAPVGVEMDSYSTFDLSVSYTFKTGAAEGLKILFGVNNVTNEMPPSAPELYLEGAGADIATYDPVGRVFFVETRYTF